MRPTTTIITFNKKYQYHHLRHLKHSYFQNYNQLVVLTAHRHWYLFDKSLQTLLLIEIDWGCVMHKLFHDVIKRKHFLRYWLFVWRIHRTGELPSQRPVTRSFDVFDLHLHKRLSKQSWGWWFETPSCSLWRHCNVISGYLWDVITHRCLFCHNNSNSRADFLITPLHNRTIGLTG